MRLSLVLLGSVLALVPFASSIFIPIATTATGTTTTLSVSAGSLAAGAAVAAAGIIGLGLAAVAIGALSGGRDDDECTGYGCPTSTYGHKRRRDVSNPGASEIDVFAMVAEMDTVGCGLRLVCHIYQKDPSELSQREKGIRALLGDKPHPVNPKDIKAPRSAYQSAAFFGEQGKDCIEIYKDCPLGTEQALLILNQISLHEQGEA